MPTSRRLPQPSPSRGSATPGPVRRRRPQAPGAQGAGDRPAPRCSPRTVGRRRPATTADDADGAGRGGSPAAAPQAPAGRCRARPGGPLDGRDEPAVAELAAPAGKASPGAPGRRAGAAAVAAADRPSGRGAPRRASGEQGQAADKANLERRNRPLGPLPHGRSTSARPRPRSPCSKAARSSSTTCRARPTTPPRSTATSTWAGSRTCCPAWRRPSSTSAPRRTPCSTGATSATTTTRSSRPASDDDGKPTRGRLGGAARDARIEQLLRTGQSIICQVTKNPIGTKGARLTQEVSLPGRFVVLIPDSDTYGISKRLGDDERRRLRKILDDIRPAGHGLIVRTAAEGASADELGRDVARLMRQWEHVQQLAKTSRAPQLLYREPDLAVRVIREEFNRDYRGVVIDDARLYDQVKEYVTSITPELADRVELVGPDRRGLAAVRAVPGPRAGAQGARPQGLAAFRRVHHHRAHRGADRHRRQHGQKRRAPPTSKRRCSATTSKRPKR